MSAIDPAKLSLVRPNDDPGVPWLGTLIGASLIGFYFWCTNQFMVQRILSAKDENHGRWGALFAGFLKLPVLFDRERAPIVDWLKAKFAKVPEQIGRAHV